MSLWCYVNYEKSSHCIELMILIKVKEVQTGITLWSDWMSYKNICEEFSDMNILKNVWQVKNDKLQNVS